MLADEINHREQAILALENQRAVPGDAVGSTLLSFASRYWEIPIGLR